MIKFFSYHFFIALAVSLLLLSSCSTTGVNPTGLMGGQVMCPSGPRPTIDCRGVLQQYSRDFKVDLNAMSKVQASLGVTTTQLTQADALTSDLLQHSYQMCTLYNACIVSPQDYAAKTEKLQDVQLQVRRTLASGGFGQQQNIQINPLTGAPGTPGSQFPPPFSGGVPPSSFPGGPPLGSASPSPFPGGATSPGTPNFGAAPMPSPQGGGVFPMGDPNLQQPGFPQAAQFPSQPPVSQPQFGTQPAGTSLAVNIPNTTGNQVGDTILNILREGSQVLKGTGPATAAPVTSRAASAPPPGQDLDSALRSMVLSLKQNVVAQNPALASGRAVVGNFTEEGQPWSGPMGALLQDRVSAIVVNDGVFNQSTGVQTRGISIKEVASVSNANDPKALPTLYNADLAIAGTYQPERDGVRVKLAALQNAGEIAETSKTIPASAIPDVVAASAQNAGDANQLLSSLNQIGPKADAQISITTNRPGPGSSFRLGEEIKYFVTSNSDGYLYLFHTDAEKSVARIFPNQYQQDARIHAGQALQVPGAGAPFKFEASPPFGLETTFAIVTTAPLAEKDLQLIQTSFASAKQEAPTFLKSRGISVVSTAPSAQAAGAPVLWNSVTVLIRP